MRTSLAARVVLGCLLTAALAGCTGAAAPAPSPSPSPSPSTWSPEQCAGAARAVGEALQRVVGSYEDTSATGPVADAQTELEDALAGIRTGVSEHGCDAGTMRTDVDGALVRVDAKGPVAQAVRARLVAMLTGQMSDTATDIAVPAGADLAAAVARAPAGAILVLAPGQYQLPGTLVLLDGVTLRGSGEQVTVLGSSAPEASVLVATRQVVTLAGLTLARDTSVPGSGIIAGAETALVLQDHRVTGARPGDAGGGAGVLVTGPSDAAGQTATSLEVTRATFADNGWAGLAVGGGHRVSIQSATFTGNGQCGLCLLDNSSGSVRDSLFDGNQVGIAVAGAAQPRLLDNRIAGGDIGLQVEGTAAPVADGTRISGAQRAAVIVGGTAGGAVANTVCEDVTYGIVVTDTAAPTLTDNDCALARGSN